MERNTQASAKCVQGSREHGETQTLTGLSSRYHNKKPISNAFKPNQPTRPAEIFKFTFREKDVAPRCLPYILKNVKQIFHCSKLLEIKINDKIL